MRKQDFDTKTKIELIKYFTQAQYEELNFRREREYKIFTWTSSILFALIGALLIYRQESAELLKSYGDVGKLTGSLAVLLLVFFSISWLNRNAKYRGQNAKALAHFSNLLHCYDEGFYDPLNKTTLFPNEWARYGEGHKKFKNRFLRPNFSTALSLLGVLAIIMIWAS